MALPIAVSVVSHNGPRGGLQNLTFYETDASFIPRVNETVNLGSAGGFKVVSVTWNLIASSNPDNAPHILSSVIIAVVPVG